MSCGKNEATIHQPGLSALLLAETGTVMSTVATVMEHDKKIRNKCKNTSHRISILWVKKYETYYFQCSSLLLSLASLTQEVAKELTKASQLFSEL